MNSIKNSLRLYKENFKYILLMCLTIVFPIQIGFTFLINYVTIPFEFFHVPLWPQLLQSFFMLIALFMIHPPFISMVAQDSRFNEVKISKLYIDTLQYMFPIYIVGIMYALIVTLGMLFLIIPGIVLLILLLPVPYVAVMDDLTWWEGIKKSFVFGRKQFFVLLGTVLMFAIVDTLLSTLALICSTLLTNLFIVSNIALLIVNALFLPLFIFTVGYIYQKWKSDMNKGQEQNSFRHQMG